MSEILNIRGAALRRLTEDNCAHMLWERLDLTVEPGEFIAILGPSGGGKTTLLRSILGLQRLSAGEVTFAGTPVRRGDARIGYVPQQRAFAADTNMRGRDLVALGLHGTRFGVPRRHPADREKIETVLSDVGATGFADRRVGLLSGGEQQRLRVGQAVIDKPALLLCDEPLSNLDLANQRAITEIIDKQRRENNTAVLFVTHDINPVLSKVDRILYLAGGRFRLGTPDEVMRSDVLGDLYGAPVDVVRTHGRVIVAGVPDAEPAHPTHHLPAPNAGGGAT